MTHWRNCKVLGSKLDTVKDFQRRKGLTIDSMREMDYIYKSKSLSIDTKVRTFNAFASSVFLYNSKLWTVAATLEKKIDSFLRRMLRQAINIRWPKKDVIKRSIRQNERAEMEQSDQKKETKLAWTYDENGQRNPS